MLTETVQMLHQVPVNVISSVPQKQSEMNYEEMLEDHH